MTRKDYVAVSEILSKYGERILIWDFDNLVNDFADLMEADNERFQRDRFVEACNEWQLENAWVVFRGYAGRVCYPAGVAKWLKNPELIWIGRLGYETL